jgi:hypothetical protein
MKPVKFGPAGRPGQDGKLQTQPACSILAKPVKLKPSYKVKDNGMANPSLSGLGQE